MLVVGDAPDGLVDSVIAYEAALVADDVDALASFFDPGAQSLRADATGLLVGSDAITRFRGRRGGIGARRIVELRVLETGADESRVVVTVNEPGSGGRGIVTQLWRLSGVVWRIAAAHVTAPAPAVDGRVWRVVGNPLVAGAKTGTLAGHTVAVKDLFAIEGQRVGVGVRVYLAEASVEARTAPAVQALLDAGADVRGIAQTDQFAYSLAGLNPDYGVPPNPRVPGGVPGGSSSGPASAVALGQATIGIGTDTAGSIRVPASYQGLWGLRTTHGAVSMEGLAPLAPRFDTVGWLTRDGETLLAAARATLGDSTVPVAPVMLCDPLAVGGVDGAVSSEFERIVAALTAAGVRDGGTVSLPRLGDLVEIFRTAQSAEAWRIDGEWVRAHPGALAPDIAARFQWASEVTPAREAWALARIEEVRPAIVSALGDAILVLPTAASAAPAIDADSASLEAARQATLGLTSIAGLSGRPALSVPWMETPAGPVGLCLVGPPGSDLRLIEMALAWEKALR